MHPQYVVYLSKYGTTWRWFIAYKIPGKGQHLDIQSILETEIKENS